MQIKNALLCCRQNYILCIVCKDDQVTDLKVKISDLVVHALKNKSITYLLQNQCPKS